MADNLKKTHFVCYYCGTVFSQKTVNKKCEKNTKAQAKDCNLISIIYFHNFRIVIGFTKKLPFNKYNGNLQHFFSFPNELQHRNVKSLFLEENFEKAEKNEKKNLENEKKNLKTFLGIFEKKN